MRDAASSAYCDARLAVLEQAVERRIGRTENGAPRDLAWAWQRYKPTVGEPQLAFWPARLAVAASI
jgi:hypothetical protein